MKRTVNGVPTVFVFDGWKPMLEFDGAGTPRVWNIYGTGADEILMRVTDTDLVRYHLDRMGNVAFLLGGDGNGVEKYTYNAFGKPKIMDWSGNERSNSAFGNRFMFTGREFIRELGIYDYRNRFYHPGIGRFLQTDPTGFDAGDMNLFRYCGDDPVNRTDPLGLTDSNYVGGEGRDWRIRYVLDNYVNPKDVISVSAHASPTGMINTTVKPNVPLTAKQVVRDIKNLDKFKNNPNMPIRLYMCRAGDWRTNKLCPAQQVANEAEGRKIQATGAWLNPDSAKKYKTRTCSDLSWYEFSKDAEPRRIDDPTGYQEGGLYKSGGVGDSESQSGTRPSFDAYGSTTAAAAAWEASWGNGSSYGRPNLNR